MVEDYVAGKSKHSGKICKLTDNVMEGVHWHCWWKLATAMTLSVASPRMRAKANVIRH